MRKNTERRHHGVAIIYAIVIMTAMCMVLSLAVDFGHAQLAKTELRSATDAAARYAVGGIIDGTAVGKAIDAAQENSVDGTPLVLLDSDVTVGTWANHTFTPGGTSPNAVRVLSQRSAVRGTAIQLFLASALGVQTCDINTSAIAVSGQISMGVIGLNYVKMGGNTSDSYWSSSGTTAAGQNGSVASNGSISLSGSSIIEGDARSYSGQVSGNVTGSRTPLTSPLVFPNGDAGAAYLTNDNASFPSSYLSGQDINLKANQNSLAPGGVYYFHNLTTKGGSNLSFSGPTTLYISGSLDLGGNTTTYDSLPGNLKIVMCPSSTGVAPGSVSLSGTSALYANIYAPQSAVQISGTGDIYGSVLGNSITMTGTSNIHYDLSLSAHGATVLVQ